MKLLRHLRNLFKPNAGERLLGYSAEELGHIFPAQQDAPALIRTRPSTAQTLAIKGVSAYYLQCLIDRADVPGFKTLIAMNFSSTNREPTPRHGIHYQHKQDGSVVLLNISQNEFNAATLRLVTNSTDLLDQIDQRRFPVPPPWVAFEGYDPAWWGGNLQGAQGFYNEQYFHHYLESLSASERRMYYTRYAATEDWINALEATLETPYQSD